MEPSDPSTQAKRGASGAYAAIVASYLHGMVRIWAARASQLTLELALMHLNAKAHEPNPAPEGYEEVLRELRTVEYRDYDAWRYVGNFGHLVYATTLLDTFLTETTRFMFLLVPASIGKAQGVTVSDIVAAKSTAELLKRAVEKRVRETSYQSFSDRVEFLADQYKLGINLPTATRTSLEHYAGIRNVVIHDQGHVDLVLSDTGEPEAVQKACPVHPRHVTGNEISSAIRAYSEVASRVAVAVFRDVLKETPPEVVKALEKRVLGAPEATPAAPTGDAV